MTVEIHLITPETFDKSELVKRLSIVHPYADYIHIRQKSWSSIEVADYVDQLLMEGIPREKLVINTDTSVASMKRVPNVHLPEKCSSIGNVRKQFPSFRIGVSVHSLDAALQKEKEGADYIMFGHIFKTESKKGLEPRGIFALEEIIHHVSIPVIAIGGITAQHISQFRQLGVHGVAVLSYVLQNDDPITAITALRREGRYVESYD